MKQYISEEDSLERISIELGPELGPIDVVRVLGEIRESATPQIFGTKKGGGSISSDVIARKGRLYFSSCDGNFYCLDADTGKKIWRFAAGDMLPAFEMDEDTIYAVCFDHNLYALTLDGKLKWRFTANGRLGNNPCPRNGRVYFGCENGNFYCVDKKGKLLWKFATESPVAAIPTVHKGLVFFGNFDGNFYALDAETGELAWKFMCRSATGGCDIHKDIIILPSVSKILYALSLEGKVLWTFKSKSNFGANIKTDLYKGMIFMGNRGKSVMAIDIKTGNPVWEFPTQEMTSSFNMVRDGVLYFGSLDCNFYAVDASTGREIWHFSATGPNVGSVEIYGDNVLFGSWDCHVYCLDRKTGQLVWKFQTSMSRMSDYEVDTRADKQEVSISLKLPEVKKKQEKPKDEVTIADYGEFSGTYIDTTKTSYLGVKKQGYVKKKGF